MDGAWKQILNNEREIEKDILDVTSLTRQIPDNIFQDLIRDLVEIIQATGDELTVEDLQHRDQENEDDKEDTDDKQIEEKSVSIHQIQNILGLFEVVISASAELGENVERINGFRRALTMASLPQIFTRSHTSAFKGFL